jgi:hypothetical protein
MNFTHSHISATFSHSKATYSHASRSHIQSPKRKSPNN